jgi:hypothetical protein
MILLGIAAIYAVWVADHQGGLLTSHIKRNEFSKSFLQAEQNPLIGRGVNSTDIDVGVPSIPGVEVYSAEHDIDRIKIDAKQREENFERSIIKPSASKVIERQQKLMIKRNNFAGKRLEFLHKIEVAKTKDERLQLIKGLKKLCEKNNK